MMLHGIYNVMSIYGFFKHMESHHRLLQGELLFIVLLIVFTIKRRITLDTSKYPKITVQCNSDQLNTTNSVKVSHYYR